jgi:hydroxyquinol 1,2-dioxygenase
MATMQGAGIHMQMGYEPYRAFQAAGLPMPDMVTSAASIRGPEAGPYEWPAETLRSMLPLTRQEPILLSDVFGLSMQVIGINHPAVDGSTESTVFGPFCVGNAPTYQNGDDLANGAIGEPCFISGTVRSTGGDPIAGAVLDVWQADSDGLYDVQRPDLSEPRARGRLTADADGRFWFWTVKPVAYPIPEDGPVGDLVRSLSPSLMRPAHVHFLVTANGYEPVTTHVFEAGDPYLDRNVVFGVKQSLIGEIVRHEPGTAPDGRRIETPYFTLAYDFTLAPAGSASR